jgi:MscS family membrane protein
MDILKTITEFEIAGNNLWRILALFGIILIAFLAGKIAKAILQKSAAKLESRDRIIAAAALNAMGRGVVFLFAAAGISLGIGSLALGGKVAEFFGTASSVLLTFALGYMLYWLVDVPTVWLTRMAGKTESKLDDMLVPIIRRSLRVTVVILVMVQIAQILSDKPITSIIAGLGIGSIVLFVDKPFEMGDRVVVDGHDGPVEEVGLRSTKIRTLDGHLVTVPNGQLANKTIQNIGKRPYIKRTVNLTVTYDTPPEKIDRAMEIVKQLLDNHEGMREDLPPRVFFNELNADSLNIMVIYWYHPPKFWDYMAFTERFNKEVFRQFNEEGIDFAFPTQTLYLAGDPSRPLNVGTGS